LKIAGAEFHELVFVVAQFRRILRWSFEAAGLLRLLLSSYLLGGEHMAETKSEKQTERSQDTKQSDRTLARQGEGYGLRRWDPAFANPFEIMERMSEEMDRWFDRATRGFGLSRPASSRSPFSSHAREGGLWFPRVEAFQKNDSFIVRADLPGLKKEDLDVDLTDDAVTIRGERRDEHQEQREGYWRSEREYGQFHRTIPLPEGVIAESAKATFRDGVLEIHMQAAPAEANRGRRLEIKDGDAEGQKK
jgi:HSP20 family protein